MFLNNQTTGGQEGSAHRTRGVRPDRRKQETDEEGTQEARTRRVDVSRARRPVGDAPVDDSLINVRTLTLPGFVGFDMCRPPV
jgi:hypothetical protein